MTEPGAGLPADSDVDIHVPGQRDELRRTPWSVLFAISLGGALGAVARYGVGVALPAPAGGFVWSTFLVNVSGCLLIGTLMVLVTEVWPHRTLLRPFLGVGVLGGYTTFSTYIVDIQRLVSVDAARTALVYLAGTAVAAFTAVYVGMVATRWALARRGRQAR